MLIFTKMKKDIEKVIEFASGVDFEVKGAEVTVKSNRKEFKRIFDFPNIKISKEGNKIKITSKKASRRESRLIGTIQAHIKNILRGFGEGFVYRLEICNVHFPMNVKQEGNKIVIKSFLGEKKERTANILNNVNAEVKGNIITLKSNDREAAGQTAANIEKATKIRGRDRGVFQDGIFIIEKPGRKL